MLGQLCLCRCHIVSPRHRQKNFESSIEFRPQLHPFFFFTLRKQSIQSNKRKATEVAHTIVVELVKPVCTEIEDGSVR